MPNYPGRTKGTRRITVYANRRQHEWIVEGTKAEGGAFEARERLRLLALSPTDERTAPRFSDFLTRHYRPYAQTHLGANTWHKVRRYQLLTLEEHFGSIRVDRLTSADLDRYKAWRLSSVKATAVNNELRVLRAALNWAKADRKLPVADVKIAMLPVRGAPRVRLWTGEEVARIFVAARDVEPDLLPMLVFLFNTGCRKGEALAAEWSWLTETTLRIPVTAEWQPKSRKPREIPLSDAVRAALAGPRRHERWLFPSSLGRQYAVFPKEAFWHVLEEAKVDGTPHWTRHTYASHFLQSTPDLFLLSAILGHSHSRTTELYAHLLPGHLLRAKNAVNLGPAPTLAGTLAAKKKRA